MAIILAPHNITENIEHQMIYQTPLFQAKFDDIDNRELEDEIYLEKKNCSGISASNPDGWHSKVYSGEEHFKVVVESIRETVPHLPFQPQLELKHISMWANVNGPGSYHITHTHPGYHLSGVYYVKVPDGDCGRLIFDDPREAISYGDIWLNDSYTGDRVERYPEEGTMFLFPASLKHFVDTNRTDSDRISISFNLLF